LPEWIGFAAPTPGRPASSRHTPKTRAGFARDLIHTRRLRDHFIPPDILADPAWDMLLELYASHYERQTVTVSSLSLASAVPTTTALRWIGVLSDRGLCDRLRDTEDGRRTIVQLSERARAQLDAYFDCLIR